jgi:hypothetical protein
MPLIGDPSRFAVEYDMNEDYGGAWMFGRFCYWCGGLQIGDFELGTSLRDVLFQLERMGRDAGHRDSVRFRTMPARDMFRLLDSVLYGDADLNTCRVAEEEQWARHNLVPPVDVFDHWKGFLVEDHHVSRVVFAYVSNPEVREFVLKPGEVDEVLNAVRRALREIYEGEVNVGEK